MRTLIFMLILFGANLALALQPPESPEDLPDTTEEYSCNDIRVKSPEGRDFSYNIVIRENFPAFCMSTDCNIDMPPEGFKKLATIARLPYTPKTVFRRIDEPLFSIQRVTGGKYLFKDLTQYKSYPVLGSDTERTWQRPQYLCEKVERQIGPIFGGF